MSNYRKLIASIIGLGLMMLNQKYGFDLTGVEPELANMVLALMTAFSVWRAPNTASDDTTFEAPAITVGLAVLLALALTGCVGSASVKATNAVAISCETYAVGLEVLTPYKAAGELSDSMIEKVDAATLLVDTVCLPGSLIDPAEGVATVQAGIALLSTIQEAF